MLTLDHISYAGDALLLDAKMWWIKKINSYLWWLYDVSCWDCMYASLWWLHKSEVSKINLD